MTSPTLTRIGKRVQRRVVFGTPRLRAIAWHRAMLLALADLDDAEAQDAAGQYHMQQLARYLREGVAPSAGAPDGHGAKEEQ